MTSNLGSHLIQERFATMTDQNKEEIWEQTKNDVFQLLRSTIRPEFLNRVDDIIMFKPLDLAEIREIVQLQFNKLQSMLSKNGMNLNITDRAVVWIAEQGFDPQFGARPVKRIMQRHLVNELSKMILAGIVNQEKPVMIDLEGDKLIFKNN